MSWASSEAISVLTFLLPGFVAAAVFYTLTSHPKPSEFERVIQALIFTIVVQALMGALDAALTWAGVKAENAVWTKSGEVFASVTLAIVLGLFAARAANNDTIHGFFRFLRFTREKSHPTEWYSVFSGNPDSYVVLHMSGQRRLYGWPEDWPNDPKEGHFSIAECEWLVDDERIPVPGVSNILVRASDVEMVEFLPAEPTEEQTD